MLDLLIKNGIVLTMANGTAGLIRSGAVGILGNTIACVGESEKVCRTYQAKETIDAEGKIIMPGFVNAHTHSTTGLAKGILVDLKYYLEQGLAGYNEGITPESQIASSKMHLLDGIRHGITTYCDTNFGSNVIAKVHEEFGTRCRISELVRELPWDTREVEGIYTFQRSYAEPYMEASKELLEKYGTDPDNRISAMVAFQGLDYCSEELILSIRDLARRYDAMIHTHIAQSGSEMHQCALRWGKRPVEIFDELGMLDEKTIGGHMTRQPREDTALAASRGVALLATPTSYGHSLSPIGVYLQEGGTAAIGTDECAYSMVNPFGEMRVAKYHACIGAHLAGAPHVKAFKILQMMTTEAAKAIGLGDQVGSLEVGKKADVIIFNPFTITMLPLLLDPLVNFINNFVTAATGEEVETVIIDGKVVMRDKKMVFLDEKAIWEEVQYEGQKAAEKAYDYYKTLPDSEVLNLQADYFDNK